MDYYGKIRSTRVSICIQ